MLSLAEPWLDRNVHPTQIIAGYQAALSDAETILKSLAFNIDPNNRAQLTNIVQSTLATKFVSRWMKLMCDIAIDATLIVRTVQNGQTDIDLKKYAKVNLGKQSKLKQKGQNQTKQAKQNKKSRDQNQRKPKPTQTNRTNNQKKGATLTFLG